MDRSYIEENDRERKRLTALLKGLSDEDLRRPLEGEWTVSAALGHLAFWDRRGLMFIEGWPKGKVPAKDPAWYADVLNGALLPTWLALPPREAVRLALEAAEAIDRVVATLDEALIQEFIAREETWRFNRWRHRREHIDEIEKALG